SASLLAVISGPRGPIIVGSSATKTGSKYPQSPAVRRFLLLSAARVVIETVFLAARRNPVPGVSRSQ
ncbi:MAG: hypothetical protein WAN00_24970, partial [Trebonia sp.]